MTVVAIHQPQYLPWVPFFDKADQCDIFVFLDTVQFQRRGVQNRNRIKMAKGAGWLTVPVNAGRGSRIKDVTIGDNRWKGKHIRSIKEHYSRARHADLFQNGLSAIMLNQWTYLADMCIAITEWFFSVLGITSKWVCASELHVGGTRDELLLNICKALGATVYLSGQGAKAYMNENIFREEGIEVRFQEYRNQSYRQCHQQIGFVPDLSALDLVLNMGKDSRDIMLEGRACASETWSLATDR